MHALQMGIFWPCDAVCCLSHPLLCYSHRFHVADSIQRILHPPSAKGAGQGIASSLPQCGNQVRTQVFGAQALYSYKDCAAIAASQMAL